MILTATGLIAIENIKKGDKVISTNAETFEAELKTVLETYIREVPQLVHLVVDGELITTTIDHPFYVKNHGFINAGKLRVGNEVINSKGDIYLVECIDIELVGKSVTVYNFQVEDYHTYHVGNIGILVHNANYPVDSMQAGKPGSKEWRDAAKRIKSGKGKGVNVNVSTEAEARALINEARPELQEFSKYSMGKNPGFEIHPIEPGFNNNLPHIKWQDWTGGKSAGANGHIFITGG